MKKIIAIFITILLCITQFGCSKLTEDLEEYQVPEELQAAYNAFIDSVSPEYAYQIALELSENKEFQSSPWGDRTAGSKAEHAAADWLAGKMKEIGLTDIEKAAAKCDLWQFNDASLQIAGDDKVITPHSYATAATPKNGITAEVVYVGDGTKYDYEGKNVKGKIVLVDVNQRDNWWITYPMLEAQHQGALAIMSAQDDGFSETSDDALNSQDICGPTSIPCVSISRNDSKYIQEKLSEGPVKVTLKVDNQVAIGEGTTYNVIGKIKGKSSDRQIIVGGHYDMYFYGFQDDNCAVGLVLAMAKAMVDSGYVPENDIVFCLHGAEEWGASNTQFDWAVGSWEMINNIYPQWQGKTLAFINFELPAYEFATYTTTVSPNEMFSMIDFYKNTWPLSPEPEGCFPEGVLTDGYPNYTYSDDFPYTIAGVPGVVNGFLFEKDREDVFPFYKERYHSNFDTKDTYNEKVMAFNLKYYGGLAIYVDQTPALYLDFTSQYDRMLAAVNEEIMKQAEADVSGYLDALDEMQVAAETVKNEVIALNQEYNQARIDKAEQDVLSEIRARGEALTDKNLNIFKFTQDAFLGLMYEMPIVPHQAPQINIETMNEVVNSLENDDFDNAFNAALSINNYLEYYAMNFSPEVIAIETDMFWGKANQNNLYWGTGRNYTKAYVNDASRGLMEKAEVEDADFTKEIAIYSREISAQAKILSELVDREIADLKLLTKMLSE